MSETPTLYVRWGIVGRYGLYSGQYLTRLAAISNHVFEMRGPEDPEVPAYTFDRRLSKAQASIWAKRKRDGDRAVKLLIRVSEPAHA